MVDCGKANRSSLSRSVYSVQWAHNVVIQPPNPNKGYWGELWPMHWAQQILDPQRSQWYGSLNVGTCCMSPDELPRYIPSHGTPNNEWPRRSRSLCYRSWRRCVCWQKTSIANSISWWSLMSSMGTLIMLCNTLLPFLLTIFPFILRVKRPQIILAAVTSSSVTSLPRTPPALMIALKSAVKEKSSFWTNPLLE